RRGRYPVISDSESPAKYCVLTIEEIMETGDLRRIGKAYARSEVVSIRIGKSIDASYLNRIQISISEKDVCHPPKFFRQRSVIFIAQAKIQCQIWAKFPIVLDEPGPIIRPEVGMESRREASVRVGIYALKDRSIVG